MFYRFAYVVYRGDVFPTQEYKQEQKKVQAMQYQQEIDSLGQRVTTLVAAMENGEDVALDALQQQVEQLCTVALALPVAERIEIRKQLEGILTQLDALALTLAARGEEIRKSLKQTTSNQQAAKAYLNAKKSDQ
jgi:hypothetical protein